MNVVLHGLTPLKSGPSPPLCKGSHCTQGRRSRCRCPQGRWGRGPRRGPGLNPSIPQGCDFTDLKVLAQVCWDSGARLGVE